MKLTGKVLFLFMIPLGAYAQFSPSAIFESVLRDARTLLNAYVEPGSKSVMYSSQGGWYSTAKTHKKWGFEVGVIYNGAFAPSKDQQFAVSSLTFENEVTSVPDITATVVGDRPPSMVTARNQQTGFEYEFEMIAGVKEDMPFGATPTATIQAAIGLPQDTDLIVRLTPQVGYKGVKGEMYGGGLKHNLMQYFKPLDKLPLNIAVIGNYTYTQLTYDVEEGNPFDGEDQRIVFQVNSYAVQAIASLDFPIVSLYGGLGYVGSNSAIKFLGNYRYDLKISGLGTLPIPIDNPADFEYKPSSVKGTLGAALKLAFAKIAIDYSIQEYNTLSAGIYYNLR